MKKAEMGEIEWWKQRWKNRGTQEQGMEGVCASVTERIRDELRVIALMRPDEVQHSMDSADDGQDSLVSRCCYSFPQIMCQVYKSLFLCKKQWLVLLFFFFKCVFVHFRMFVVQQIPESNLLMLVVQADCDCSRQFPPITMEPKEVKYILS